MYVNEIIIITRYLGAILDEIKFFDSSNNIIDNSNILLYCNSQYDDQYYSAQHLIDGLSESAGQGYWYSGSETNILMKFNFSQAFDINSIQIVNTNSYATSAPQILTMVINSSGYQYKLDIVRNNQDPDGMTQHYLADAELFKVKMFNNGIMKANMIDGGNTRVHGIISVNGTPVMRRVRLFEQLTGRFIREMWSDKTTGAYSFDYLRSTKYFITVHDHTGNYDIEARGDISSEIMS